MTKGGQKRKEASGTISSAPKTKKTKEWTVNGKRNEKISLFGPAKCALTDITFKIHDEDSNVAPKFH